MGCKNSKERTTVSQTGLLDADWLPFLDAKTPTEFSRNVYSPVTFASHSDGQAWAECALQRIDAGLRSRALGGNYEFRQSGEVNSGVISITCKTTEHAGADRNFLWNLFYVLASHPDAKTNPAKAAEEASKNLEILD